MCKIGKWMCVCLFVVFSTFNASAQADFSKLISGKLIMQVATPPLIGVPPEVTEPEDDEALKKLREELKRLSAFSNTKIQP